MHGSFLCPIWRVAPFAVHRGISDRGPMLLLGSLQRAGRATFLLRNLGESHFKALSRGKATIHLSWSLTHTFQKAV